MAGTTEFLKHFQIATNDLTNRLAARLRFHAIQNPATGEAKWLERDFGAGGSELLKTLILHAQQKNQDQGYKVDDPKAFEETAAAIKKQLRATRRMPLSEIYSDLDYTTILVWTLHNIVSPVLAGEAPPKPLRARRPKPKKPQLRLVQKDNE